MAIKTVAKNVEIYIGTVADVPNFDPSARGNNKTLAEYMQASITASDITNWKKVSDFSNEISIEPSEDSSESTLYFGSTVDGSQNSETSVTLNPDVDISIKADELMDFSFNEYALTNSGITHSGVTGYKSFSLGATSDTPIVLFVRIKKIVSSTYYFKNYIILDPVFKKAGNLTGSSSDAVIGTEISLTGNKSKIWFDYYNDTTDESTTSF